MAADINDKFKKVSADNSYAVATTVKTARTVGGGTTLEAFDLSKWADATAVNFLTYRKTTDPVTNVTTVTNRTGWTALVNTGSNTLTNLTVAPGYTDLGHQVGDYIEPVQMSKWANDLVDGLLTSHNQNGTLKNNSVTTAAIANNAVTAPKIDFTTFPGITTQSNPGSAGGNLNLVKIGNLRYAFGTSINRASGSSPNLPQVSTVTFPSGFFSSTPVCTVSAGGPLNSVATQVANVNTVSINSLSYYQFTTAGAGSAVVQWVAIGT